jgi:hypothetical protein
MQDSPYADSRLASITLNDKDLDKNVPSKESRCAMMTAVAVPVLETKEDAWKAWLLECTGPRREEFDRFNERMGLTLHRAWLVQSLQGPLAVAVFDGPGAENFLQKMATSQEPFDRWFRERVAEFHAIDLSKPDMLSPGELFLDWQARRHAFAEITE